MADESAPEPKTEPAEPTPKKSPPRRRTKAAPKEESAPAEKKSEVPAKDEGPRVPRRADLPQGQRTLMRARDDIDRRRPLFGRQARYRYYRIGRDMSWRAPRGLQSKQRRHYGYRPRVVRVGYRGPARVRGLVPSGFRPIIVHTTRDLEALNAKLEAAIIARTVGTRRRLVLEETARKLGIRVLNPIVKSEREG
ncbi:MAG: 50S ribosomal protein L32e [Thermoplasmata archaeon]|jgi:large subunit ribosomal protein L32e